MALPFTLFIYEHADQLALRTANSDAGRAYWDRYDAIGKAMGAAGILRGGAALGTTGPVTLVANGAPRSAPSPYASSAHALGGYFQIEVADAADASAWAARLPAEGGVVEVRPGFPIPAAMGMN